MLHLKENGTLCLDFGRKETSLLGDVDLCEGKHCWGFQLRKYDNYDMCIGMLKYINDVRKNYNCPMINTI